VFRGAYSQINKHTKRLGEKLTRGEKTKKKKKNQKKKETTPPPKKKRKKKKKKKKLSPKPKK